MQLKINRYPFTRALKQLALLGAVFFIAGCALHPEKMGKNELWQKARSDLATLALEQESMKAPVTLYEAMARAIKYNREYRIYLMKSGLSLSQAKLTRYDMLPDIAFNAGYMQRDNDSASSSQSFLTGQESLEASISQDREKHNGDAAFTWSILDFGLSYVKAQQESDRYLIAREAERKTIHNIINDVGTSWWEALSAQRLQKQVPPLMEKVKKMLEASRQIEAQRLDAPVTALEYQRSLLNMLRTLERLNKELMGAKSELAHLMGVSPQTNFTIADPGDEVPLQTPISWNVKTMEKIALLSRPELMEGRYQIRISQKETRRALLSLLPNLNLDAGWNYDSNSYLVNHSWYDFGGRLSGSLLNILKMPKTLKNAEVDQALKHQQHLLMSSTILMQVHLAKAAHIQSAREFELENLIFMVEDRILKQKTNAKKSGSDGQQAVIGQELNRLLAKFRRDAAYAEMQNNFGRLLWTMGVDPVPPFIDGWTLRGLTVSIKTHMENWQKSSLVDVEGLEYYLPKPKS
ncbi:MAG: TolC family protein [Desulfobacterales bacterium]|nr:TolC family protein [Desulfobacterales bacterium]